MTTKEPYSLPRRFMGRLGYEKVWELQEKIRRDVLLGKDCEQLVVVEHPRTLSLGRGESGDNLTLAPEILRQQGFDVIETNRGGKVTYHGPGQLVAYPIVDVRRFGPGVKRYVERLEQVMLECLRRLQINGQRKDGCPGAWVAGKKIGSIGIHVRRQISIHGLSFNVCPELGDFKVITPCGIQNIQMTSLVNEGVPATIDSILPLFFETFSEVFGCTLFSDSAFESVSSSLSTTKEASVETRI